MQPAAIKIQMRHNYLEPTRKQWGWGKFLDLFGRRRAADYIFQRGFPVAAPLFYTTTT
jgi:hypothetical protein